MKDNFTKMLVITEMLDTISTAHLNINVSHFMFI